MATRIQLKINGVEQHRTIPDSITELSFGKFIALNEAYASGNSRKALAVWLDVTEQELDGIKANSLDRLERLVGWYDNEAVRFVTGARMPIEVAHNGGVIDIPTVSNFEDSVTIGQFMAFDDLSRKFHPYVAAIAAYLSPKMVSGGKYDDALEKTYILQAQQMPAYLAYPIAVFFCRSRRRRQPTSTASASPTIPTWLRLDLIALTVLAIGILLTLWLTVG